MRDFAIAYIAARTTHVARPVRFAKPAKVCSSAPFDGEQRHHDVRAHADAKPAELGRPSGAHDSLATAFPDAH